MTWREPDHPHACVIDACPRRTPVEGSPCWVHGDDGVQPTELGRDLGLRPGPAQTVIPNRPSAAITWTPFAATLHQALDRRSRPERAAPP